MSHESAQLEGEIVATTPVGETEDKQVLDISSEGLFSLKLNLMLHFDMNYFCNIAIIVLDLSTTSYNYCHLCIYLFTCGCLSSFTLVTPAKTTTTTDSVEQQPEDENRESSSTDEPATEVKTSITEEQTTAETESQEKLVRIHLNAGNRFPLITIIILVLSFTLQAPTVSPSETEAATVQEENSSNPGTQTTTEQ